MAHLLGGVALVLSFALLSQRRIGAMVTVCGLQAWAVGAAVLWQGWARGAPSLAIAALVALAGNGLAIPLALRRIARPLDPRRPVATALGTVPRLIAGVSLVALAILAVLPASLPAGVPTREDLALALSVVLLGLLTMLVRHGPPAQAVGFLSVGNGLVLAAVGAAGMPFLVPLAVGSLVLVACVVGGAFVFHLRAHLGDPGAAGEQGAAGP